MRKITSAELEEMRRIANRLIDFVDRLEGEPVSVATEVQAEVKRKVAARICLACDSPIPMGIKVKRGQEESCYNTTRGRIRKGDVRERELILAGKLTAESTTPGRRAKQDLSSDEKRLRVAEQMEKYNEKRGKRSE